MRVWRDSAVSRLLVYGANTTLGWRVIRTISFEKGERGIEQGKFRRVNDEITGKHLGYQFISSAEQHGDKDLPSLPSAATISQREMQINAGEIGRSRTAGLREQDRELLRVPEDRVERVQAKIRVYLQVGPEKGAILLAWPK